MSQSQLYEWIKASEKLPIKEGEYVCKTVNSKVPSYQGCGIMLFKDGQFWTEEDGMAKLEWLSPVSTDWREKKLDSQQHQDSNVPCVAQVDSSNSIEHYKKFKDILTMIITLEAVVKLIEHKVGLNTIKELRWHITNTYTT